MIAAFVFFNKYTIASVKVLMFLNLFVFSFDLGDSATHGSETVLGHNIVFLFLLLAGPAVPGGEVGWGRGGGLGEQLHRAPEIRQSDYNALINVISAPRNKRNYISTGPLLKKFLGTALIS